MVLGILLMGCGGGVAKQYRPAEWLTRWDNAGWAKVLDQIATEDGFVRYEPLKSNDAGVRETLYRYVGALAEASPDNRPDLFPSADDRLAYWINAYNAICLY